MAQVVARRGDLMALARTGREFSSDEETTRVSLGVVTSVTRDGVVKAWDSPFLTKSESRSVPLRRSPGDQLFVVSATEIDVPAVMSAYRSHTWDGHDQIKEFDSVKDCTDFLRTFRLAAGGSDGA